MPPRFADRPVTRALARFAAWMLFGFLLVESLHVAIDWWHGRLPVIGWREGFWLLLFPVLIAVFLRYFSIFRPGCRACAPPAPSADRRNP